MDRADVIIFGGGLVGLALASALDSSGMSLDHRRSGRSRRRQDAAFDGRTSAVSSSSMRMLETIGVTRAFRGARLPDPADRGRRRPRARRTAFRSGDDDEPLGWMHENRQLARRAAGRAEAGKNIWLLWKSRAGQRRSRRAWRRRCA